MGRKLPPLGLAIAALLLCIVNAIEECTTPNFIQGKCVSNDECPSYVQIMRGQKPLKTKIQEYLNNSNCFGVSNPSTCCVYPKVEVTPPSPPVAVLPPRSKCGIMDGDQIVGGIEASMYDYPWMALIEYRTTQNTTTLKCGGSLISAKYVLTAAQCVYGNVYVNVGTPTHVRLGEYDTMTDPDCSKDNSFGDISCIDKHVSIPIEKIIIHPDYDPSNSYKNDIAIIRLTKEAPNTDTIGPICLPENDLTIGKKDNELFFKMAGWGVSQVGQKSYNKKMHFSVQYKTLNTCQKAYAPLHANITKKHICTKANWGNNSCQADAGSPLMYMTYTNLDLIGVFSFSATSCTTSDIPSVYTKTHDYLGWIKSQMEL
ncbi:phenoloxidase-activating enzyme-like [Arctopsyche grandis]|uniref:phenoloxidase-activating enzyme-like n=1 Tax=Arctopsyche grandis TaxID=121162 RepID=UPI00406D9AFF